MRVIVLSNNFSGVKHFRQELIEKMLGSGYEVIIAAPQDQDTSHFDLLGCQTVTLAFNRRGTNPLSDLFLAYNYYRLMLKYSPDVILTYTIKPNLYGGIASRCARIPQVANITGLGSAVENPGPLQKLTKLLYRICLRKTEMVFFQNESNMRFCLNNKMVRGNYRLIPGSGVNLEKHKAQPYPADGPMKFIYIGRVMKEKGIDQYLDAAKFITAKYPGTKFYVMGRCDNYYIELINALNASGIINYLGRQDDVRPFIGMTHCTIHPSYYPEGMSNVLLESCAASRPIITTDRPGCREIVLNEKTGYVVKQKDSSDLIDKIEKFIQIPYEEKIEMGKAGRHRVETLFDRNIVITAYLETISSICNV